MNHMINRTSPRVAGWTRTAAVSLLAVVSLAACSSNSISSAPSSAPGASSPASSAPASSAPASPTSPKGNSSATLKTANSSFGEIVVDGKGMTAYIYTPDKPGSGMSACTGECASLWPAITTSSATVHADGIAGKLGTIKGVDGKPQVTLNGHPLYTYAQDSAPGDVNGQGLMGIWYVVSPNGTKITGSANSGGGSNGGY
jgi:predicted lipoprotein with Yx(FWY)xxD motif